MDQVSSKIMFCIIKLTNMWAYEMNVFDDCSLTATKTSFVTNGRQISKQYYIYTAKGWFVFLWSQI